MSNQTTAVSRRPRKTQEQVAVENGGSRRSFILSRLLEEVASPLDESASICRRLLDGSGDKLSPEQRRCVESVAGCAGVMSRRLRDYVDLLRIEMGDLLLRPKALDVQEAISQAARQHKLAARAKGLGLVVEPSLRALPPVLADPTRVAQVLSALIANAIKFTDRGQVTISTELYDRSIAIHVVDTGGGIPAAQLPRLHEDFFQGEGARARDPQGCGLGLTLGRRLVIRMGGDFWVTSTVGAGSKFSFTVPRSPEAAGPSRVGTA